MYIVYKVCTLEVAGKYSECVLGAFQQGMQILLCKFCICNTQSV